LAKEHVMNDYIELPTMEARNWIAGGARACGYSGDEPDFFGYLAWWLENRSVSGVLRTGVYLLMVHDMPFDDLQPRRIGENLACLCRSKQGKLPPMPPCQTLRISANGRVRSLRLTL
jgi:hypothetical protein